VREGLTLRFDAGVEREFHAPRTSVATSLGVAYRGVGVAGGATLDVAWNEGWKVVVAGNLGGSFGPGRAHSLSADLWWAIAPTTRLRAEVGYAYHATDVTLLAYQRLRIAEGEGPDGIELEGEAALAWRAHERLRVRPAVAYRADARDPAAFVVQFALGATHYPAPRFGVGTVVYHVRQPSLALASSALGLEARFAITASLHVVGGYTHGQGLALMPGSAQGWHVRLDVQGGTE
jgi:hypothetical protein